MKRLLLPLLFLSSIQLLSAAVVGSFTEDWAGYQSGDTATQILANGKWSRYGWSNTDWNPSFVITSQKELSVTNDQSSLMGLVSVDTVTLGEGLALSVTLSILEPSKYVYTDFVLRNAGSDKQRYYFRVRTDSVAIAHANGGGSTDLKTFGYTLPTDGPASFSFQLVPQGDSAILRVLLNGVLIGAVEDTAPPSFNTSLQAGFQVRQNTSGTTSPVVFGEFSVEAIPEPSSALLGVAAGAALFGVSRLRSCRHEFHLPSTSAFCAIPRQFLRQYSSILPQKSPKNCIKNPL